MLKKTIGVCISLVLSMILVIPVWAGCGSPGDLVVSEIDYDQDGTDAAEFIEFRVVNAVTLADCELRMLNGNGGVGVQYSAVALSGTFPPGYLVVGTPNFGDNDFNFSVATNAIQNGAPDGFALIDTSGGGAVPLWVLSYEGVFTYTLNTVNYFSVDIGCVDIDIDPALGQQEFSCNNGTVVGHTDWYTSTSITRGTVNPNALKLSGLNATSTVGVLLLASLLMTGMVVVLRKK